MPFWQIAQIIFDGFVVIGLITYLTHAAFTIERSDGGRLEPMTWLERLGAAGVILALLVVLGGAMALSHLFHSDVGPSFEQRSMAPRTN